MFKFNFNVDSEGAEVLDDKKCVDQEPESAESVECYDSEKIIVEDKHFENLDIYRASCTTAEYGDLEMSYLLAGCVGEILKDKGTDIKQAEEKHSDLIPGVYEGGAKIWECTEDLLQYMARNPESNIFQEKRILDMGCGAGLLGVYTLLKGGTVEFQDYNKDVLETITIPNVLLNLADSKEEIQSNLRKVSFYSGDWSKYAELTKGDEKFDIILTSETIYNPNNYKKLVDVFKRKLKKDGQVLLAAKIYYFGVGGGLRTFEEYLANDKTFDSKSVWQSASDVHREILEIRFKENVQ